MRADGFDNDAFKQGPQMSPHPADRVAVKEVCVVLERALKFRTESSK
jgi:hypothetical protein